MKPLLNPDSISVAALAWPAGLAALRQLFPGRRAEQQPVPSVATEIAAPPPAPASPKPKSLGWTNDARLIPPPGPVVRPVSEPFTPPEPPRGNFRIHCLPLGPSAELSLRVKAECDEHEALGYSLVSSFSHDGDAFLIFKRK